MTEKPASPITEKGTAGDARTRETAIKCVSAVFALALLIGGLAITKTRSPVAVIFIAIIGVAALGVIVWSRHLTIAVKAKTQLGRVKQYHQLADEYRRLSDMAITAQEHTDLKIGEVSAQMDYLREQMEALRKILNEVE
jgi:hypothetical protein